MIQIISFEGLCGSLGRWVRRGLLSRVRAEWPGADVDEYLWTQLGGTYGPCIVIGHSFGVRSAVKSAIAGRDCKLLLLLDPRMPPWGTGGVVAPKGVRTVCIYREGLMRGYPVEGAHNIRLKGVSHVGVPFTDEALEQVRIAMGGV